MLNWLKKKLSFDSPPSGPSLTDLLKQIQAQQQQTVPVTPTSVLGFPPIWRGVNIVSGIVASLPINVLRTDTREIDIEHPGNWTINHPHTLYGRFSLIRSLVKDVLIYGGGFCRIIKEDTKPTRLTYLQPWTVRWDDEGKGQYKINTGQADEDEIDPEYIFHVKGLGNPFLGLDPLFVHRESLSLGLSMQSYGKYWFQNSVSSQLFFKLAGWLKDNQQIQQFKDGIKTGAVSEAGYIASGIAHAGEPSILQGGADVVAVPPPSNEQAQWSEGRDCEAIASANIIGVPPHMVGAKLSSSYSSYEAEMERFLSDIEPLISALEEEANIKLLSESEKRRESRYFRVAREHLLKPDATEADARIVTLWQAGLLEKNEAREMLGLPEIEEQSEPETLPIEDNLDDSGQQPDQGDGSSVVRPDAPRKPVRRG